MKQKLFVHPMQTNQGDVYYVDKAVNILHPAVHEQIDEEQAKDLMARGVEIEIHPRR